MHYTAAFLVLSIALTTFLAPAASAVRRGGIGEQVEISFNRLDTNGDDQVSEEEYVEAQLDALKKRFKQMDRDRDGALSEEEYKDALEDANDRRRDKRGNGERPNRGNRN